MNNPYKIDFGKRKSQANRISKKKKRKERFKLRVVADERYVDNFDEWSEVDIADFDDVSPDYMESCQLEKFLLFRFTHVKIYHQVHLQIIIMRC